MAPAYIRHYFLLEINKINRQKMERTVLDHHDGNQDELTSKIERIKLWSTQKGAWIIYGASIAIMFVLFMTVSTLSNQDELYTTTSKLYNSTYMYSFLANVFISTATILSFIPW